MHRVAVLVLPPVTTFDVAIPGLILGNARVDGAPAYAIRMCTAQRGAVACVDAAHGVELSIRWGLGILRESDTIIVVGSGSRDPIPATVAKALRVAMSAGKRVVSLCTGAFALAQAGLLDGRSATTYWVRTQEFRERFPEVDVRPDVLFVEDGNLLTSAGVAAGIDLCLHLVTRDHGAAVANDVARSAVVAPARAGGQAQFVPNPASAERGGSLAELRAWMTAHLDRPITLADMAKRCHLSERSLTRRFRAETGTSLQQWLLLQRIARARGLLETTTLPVDRIAESSGIGTADSLRQHFAERLGVSPTAYRAAFGHARRVLHGS
jgi:transcriptional regulator GlxA family with amidase domain